jgi:hypothetical protein
MGWQRGNAAAIGADVEGLTWLSLGDFKVVPPELSAAALFRRLGVPSISRT